jgi:hypothetical protein
MSQKILFKDCKYRERFYNIEVHVDAITSKNIEGQKFHRIVGTYKNAISQLDCTTSLLFKCVEEMHWTINQYIDREYEAELIKIYKGLSEAEKTLLKIGFTMKEVK